MSFVRALLILLVWAGVLAGVVVIQFIRWAWKHTCFFRHRNKRFLSMDYHGHKNAQGVLVPRCRCWADRPGEITDHHRFHMRWFCDACNEMGEHCWDETGEWKLEHGRIVPDAKRWAQRQ